MTEEEMFVVDDANQSAHPATRLENRISAILAIQQLHTKYEHISFIIYR